jgi:hypothetical protein
MSQYVAKPFEVRAEVIVEVLPLEVLGTLDLSFAYGVKLVLENGDVFKAPREMIIRHIPRIGDFLVNDDGYFFVEPKELFGRRYRAVLSN